MKLTFYMKSGNKIVQRFVKEYEFQNQGNEIVGIRIESYNIPLCGKILIKTIALDQIECIVRS